jgi:hypothetical protein
MADRRPVEFPTQLDAKSAKPDGWQRAQLGLPTAASILLVLTHVWPWALPGINGKEDFWIGVALGQLSFWPLFAGVLGTRLRWPMTSLAAGVLCAMAMAWLCRWQLGYPRTPDRSNDQVMDLCVPFLAVTPVLYLWLFLAGRRLRKFGDSSSWRVVTNIAWSLAKVTFLVAITLASMLFVSWAVLPPRSAFFAEGAKVALAAVSAVIGLAAIAGMWGGLIASVRHRPPWRWRRIAATTIAVAVAGGLLWWRFAWPQVLHHRAYQSLVAAKAGVSTHGGFYDPSKLPPWRRWFDQYAPYIDGILFDGETQTAESLSLCRNLRDDRMVVELWNPDEEDEMIREISGIKGAWFLTIGHPYLPFDSRTGKMGDSGLKHVAAMENVSLLDLFNTNITGRGIEHLLDMPNLTTLRISSAPIRDDDLTPISRMPHLRSLHLSYTEITDRGMEHLIQLHSLRSLGLNVNKISGDGLTHLSRLTQLEHIGISGTKVDDEALRHLAHHTNLRSLNLQNTKITGRGFSYLVRLPALESIKLDRSPVDNVGAMSMASLALNVQIDFGEIRTVTFQGILALHRERVRLHGMRTAGADDTDFNEETDLLADDPRDVETPEASDLPGEDHVETVQQSDFEQAELEFERDAEVLRRYGVLDEQIESYRRQVFGEPLPDEEEGDEQFPNDEINEAHAIESR